MQWISGETLAAITLLTPALWLLRRGHSAGEPLRSPFGLAGLLPRGRGRGLSECTTSVHGMSREKVCDVADELGLIQLARTDLRSRLWTRRLGAVRLCSRLGISHSEVEPLTHDAHPLVRAEAIAMVAASPTADRDLLQKLEEPTRTVRSAVLTALISNGAPISQTLESYLTASAPEDWRATGAIDVAAELANLPFLEPALAHSRHPDPARRRACARLLAALGGERAVSRLEEMLNDSDPNVREGAQKSLTGLQAVLDLLEG